MTLDDCLDFQDFRDFAAWTSNLGGKNPNQSEWWDCGRTRRSKNLRKETYYYRNTGIGQFFLKMLSMKKI
jgi:hypothetical protein